MSRSASGLPTIMLRPEHHDVRAADLDSAFPQQTQTAERRARDETGRIAEREFRDVHRMKSIDIFRRIERADDRRFIDLFGRRRLDENAVNRRIAIQFLDAREKFGLRRSRRAVRVSRNAARARGTFCPSTERRRVKQDHRRPGRRRARA